MLLRKKDFPALGLPSSWTTINGWIDDPEIKFPPGRVVANQRIWTQEEILEWIKTRPTAKRPARGICKSNHEARLAADDVKAA